MPRPDVTLLDLARYPVRVDVQTRFQDLDPMGHLNNVAFAALFESARVQFNLALGRMNRSDGFRGVVARCEINYLAEGSYPEPVEIASGIGAIGGRSWDVLQAMAQNGRPIGTCSSTLVMTHPVGEPISAVFRGRLEEMRLR